MPLFAIIGLIVVAAIPVTVLVIVAWVGRQRAERVNANWSGFAARRGWRFTPARGGLCGRAHHAHR
jgi:hypothetical protein